MGYIIIIIINIIIIFIITSEQVTDKNTQPRPEISNNKNKKITKGL